MDQENNLYILDANNNRIMVYTSEGEFLRQIGSVGSGKGELYACWDFALDKKGRVYVADAGNYRIQIFSREGDYIAEFSVDHEVRFIECGPGGNLYINSDASKGEELITVLSPEGKVISTILNLVPDEKNRPHVLDALNRFRLSLGGDGSILLARSPLALLEKYDDELNRSFQLHISGPEVDYGRRVLYQSRQEFFGDRKMEGKDKLEDFIEDVVIACSDGHPHGMEYIPEVRCHHGSYYVLVVGVIHVYGQSGNLLRKYRLQDVNGDPAYVHSICFDKQGFLLGLDRFHTSKCYRFRMPG